MASGDIQQYAVPLSTPSQDLSSVSSSARQPVSHTSIKPTIAAFHYLLHRHQCDANVAYSSSNPILSLMLYPICKGSSKGSNAPPIAKSRTRLRALGLPVHKAGSNFTLQIVYCKRKYTRRFLLRGPLMLQSTFATRRGILD